MKLVKEFPKLTKVEIVLGKEGKFIIRSLMTGEVLAQSFGTIREAVTYSVGAFLVPTNTK